MSVADTGTGLTVRRVTAADWPLVDGLFGDNGACGGCWCMYWHAPPGEAAWNRAKGAANRLKLKEEIENGRCQAVVAVRGGDAIGWCRFGPTGSFRDLGEAAAQPTHADYAFVFSSIGKRQKRRRDGVAQGCRDRCIRRRRKRDRRLCRGPERRRNSSGLCVDRRSLPIRTGRLLARESRCGSPPHLRAQARPGMIFLGCAGRSCAMVNGV